MSNSYHNFTIKDKQQALDILDIPRNMLHSSREEVAKQAKINTGTILITCPVTCRVS